LRICWQTSSVASFKGSQVRLIAGLGVTFAGLILLHLPLLHLPYFWDEAGYYIPAALDFYRHGLLIPHSTLPSGHTPLVPVYLGVVWRVFGFSELVTRTAMLFVAAATVVTTYLLGREVGGRETGIWGASLLAVSPLFFAQSSLAFLDLPAACFTVLAVLFLLEKRCFLFALSGIGAVMSKETAIVMLPVMWGFVLVRCKDRRWAAWAARITPIIPLAVWALYYHHETGFWTGNPQYLEYNLYSALTPLHILRSFVARCYEVLVQGFNWLLTAGAVVGIWCMKKSRYAGRIGDGTVGEAASIWSPFRLLAISIIVGYVLMLSFVGGAVLSRYMLPVTPLYIILTLDLMRQAPTTVRRVIAVVAVISFVASWFINPPYPFPYENNLSYADFVQLHQKAAKYLESLPGNPVILTAWPATDELHQTFLGYVSHPLRVVPVEGFTIQAFTNPPRFNLLYAYSRKWQPEHNLLTLAYPIREFLGRFYDYHPRISIAEYAAQHHLKLLRAYERRGQWVRLYEGQE
jgi:4-amino-4-deoxy-L-arabinose transferase-like glycosyltransferase